MYYNGSRKIKTQIINNITYYVKELSEQETISEIVASRVGKILGFDVVENYQMYLQYLYSKQYNQLIEETKVDTKENLYNVDSSTIFDMNIFDYIIINRDRHMGNIEVLKNIRYNKYRLSSLYDFNISLLSTMSDESLNVVDGNYNPITQSYNNKSLLENIEEIYYSKYYKYIPKYEIYLSDIQDLFEIEEINDLYVNNRLNIIIESINRRLRYLLEIGILQVE